MKINVFAKNTEIDNSIKDYTRTKAEGLGKFFEHIQDIEVVLDTEGESITAEMIVNVRKKKLISKVKDNNIHRAIDKLCDKIERQLIRRKEKKKSHRLRPIRESWIAPEEVSKEEESGETEW